MRDAAYVGDSENAGRAKEKGEDKERRRLEARRKRPGRAEGGKHAGEDNAANVAPGGGGGATEPEHECYLSASCQRSWPCRRPGSRQRSHAWRACL
eukprot:16431333-Heterocapsa_arctica.AAC.1